MLTTIEGQEVVIEKVMLLARTKKKPTHPISRFMSTDMFIKRVHDWLCAEGQREDYFRMCAIQVKEDPIRTFLSHSSRCKSSCDVLPIRSRSPTKIVVADNEDDAIHFTTFMH